MVNHVQTLSVHDTTESGCMFEVKKNRKNTELAIIFFEGNLKGIMLDFIQISKL